MTPLEKAIHELVEAVRHTDCGHLSCIKRAERALALAVAPPGSGGVVYGAKPSLEPSAHPESFSSVPDGEPTPQEEK